MGKEEKETKSRFGLANFESRKHPRFSVDLPVEYWQTNNLKSRPSRTINVSEGGLMLHLSEELEGGQNLRLRLSIDSGPGSNSIEALVQVVWQDIHLGEDGNYRSGVKFVDISPGDMDKLKNFLNTLMNLKAPSLETISGFASILTNFSTPDPLHRKTEKPGG